MTTNLHRLSKVLLAGLTLALASTGSSQQRAATATALPASVPERAAAELLPTRVRNEMHLGQRLLLGGAATQAIEHLDIVVSAAPEHPAGWFLLARARQQAGQSAPALEAAERALSLIEALPEKDSAHFDRSQFHLLVGQLELANGQLERAETSLARAVELAPLMAGLRHQLGDAMLRRGRSREAAEQFRVALTREPDGVRNPDTRIFLGQALLDLGDMAGAEAMFREAIEMAPQSASAHNGLAAVFRATQREAEQAAEVAIFEKLRAAEQARETSDQEVDTLVREASVKLGEGKAAEAIAQLEVAREHPHVVATGHRRVRILTDLARARTLAEDAAGALDAYKEAIEIEPTTFLARLELGTMLARGGRVSEALPHLIQAVASQPLDHGAHVNLALAWALAGRLNLALAEATKASSLVPDDMELRQLVVDLRWAAGERESAMALAEFGGLTVPGQPAAPTDLPEGRLLPAGAKRSGPAPLTTDPAWKP